MQVAFKCEHALKVLQALEQHVPNLNNIKIKIIIIIISKIQKLIKIKGIELN